MPPAPIAGLQYLPEYYMVVLFVTLNFSFKLETANQQTRISGTESGYYLPLSNSVCLSVRLIEKFIERFKIIYFE